MKVARKSPDGSITPSDANAVVRGMEVDLALAPLIWVSESEDGNTTVGVSYKVSKIQFTDGPGGKTDEQEIEIDL